MTNKTQSKNDPMLHVKVRHISSVESKNFTKGLNI